MRTGKKPTEPKPTGIDWQRVKSEAAGDAAVAHDSASDAAPYDPNDPAAVATFGPAPASSAALDGLHQQ